MRRLACLTPGNWPKRRIARRVQNSENHSTSRLDHVEDRERKSVNNGSANLAMNGRKHLGIQLDGPER